MVEQKRREKVRVPRFCVCWLFAQRACFFGPQAPDRVWLAGLCQDLTCILRHHRQTKELLAELQDLLPNTDDSTSSNLTMNTVLQCAIDFLTSRAANSGAQESSDDAAGGHDIDVAYRHVQHVHKHASIIYYAPLCS